MSRVRRCAKKRGGVWIDARRVVHPIRMMHDRHLILSLNQIRRWAKDDQPSEIQLLRANARKLKWAQYGNEREKESAIREAAKLEEKADALMRVKPPDYIVDKWPVYLDLEEETIRRGLDPKMTREAAMAKWGTYGFRNKRS